MTAVRAMYSLERSEFQDEYDWFGREITWGRIVDFGIVETRGG